MRRLYTYVIPYDEGAAPNPYGQVCTLAICKPQIRRTAGVGDWVVGMGAKSINGVNYSNRVVYAMLVTEVLSFAEYDTYCREELKVKIPDPIHPDYERRVGDCLYYYDENGDPCQRQGVHSIKSMKKDLNGLHVLLSDHFYYFGQNAIRLPEELLPIVKQGQGHRSAANAKYFERFEQWIEGLGFEPNEIHGPHQISVDSSASGYCNSHCNDED